MFLCSLQICIAVITQAHCLLLYSHLCTAWLSASVAVPVQPAAQPVPGPELLAGLLLSLLAGHIITEGRNRTPERRPHDGLI
jgi:hypothetical protein